MCAVGAPVRAKKIRRWDPGRMRTTIVVTSWFAIVVVTAWVGSTVVVRHYEKKFWEGLRS